MTRWMNGYWSRSRKTHYDPVQNRNDFANYHIGSDNFPRLTFPS